MTTLRRPSVLSATLEEAAASKDSVDTGGDPSTHPLLGNKKAERALVRKLDIRLVTFAFIMQGLCFLDRSNIGNARVAGLEEDLGLHGYEYNIALTLFFVSYTLVEVPSNLALKSATIGPHLWLALLLTGFGLVTLCTAFIQSYGGLIAVRLMLGLTEGGVMPGVTHYLARFYRRSELVLRVGIFVSASSLAAAFGSLIASGILHVGSVGSVKSWRNIFLVEGIITTGCGLITLLFLRPILPSEPAHAGFLTPEERTLAIARVRCETVASPAGGKKMVERTDWGLVGRGVGSINVCIFVVAAICAQISVQGLSLFMPTIVRGLDPSATMVQVQLKSAAPFCFSFVWSLAHAYACDKLNRRAAVLMVSVPVSIIGYAIFVGTNNPRARYAAAFFAAGGVFTVVPTLMAWIGNNVAPDTSRATAVAMVVGLSSIGAVAATWSYLPSDAPNYPIGNRLNLVSTCVLFALVCLAWFYNSRENRLRAAGKRDHRIQGKSQAEIARLGSRHPAFVFSV